MTESSQTAPISVGEAVRLSAEHLTARGIESARLDAELLMAHALGLSRLQLYLVLDRPLSPEERIQARDLLMRRAKREPIAHITGEKEFYSLPFRVSPDVLIPRPETELLVETIITGERAGEIPPGPILDIGTGSGAIAVALARNMAGRGVIATDISSPALEIAGYNADRHGVADHVILAEGDLSAGQRGPFAAVVSNPPYVAQRDRSLLAPEVLREPDAALFAGEDGLDIVRRIIDVIPPMLAKGGWLLIEVGAGQAPEVADLMRRSGKLERIETLSDLAKIERAVLGRRVGG